ncbi:MAG: helix-turn-helix transcriptional regulator [Angelakisella sp.]|jgi:transcriptional regulator with XRE-family HTH domain|nr:helix-turn-helix transcriptional regulator [Angelakisella sp.]
MITRFGKELRKLRIDHGEILKDMANRLGVSPAFLSAVEVGKKNIPEEWPKKIAAIYKLNPDEEESLLSCAKESVRSIKIDLSSVGDLQHRTALVFARDFNGMSDETAERILQLIQGDKHKEGF